MEFKEQIKNIELVINRTPRIYLKWENTEEGRDTSDCYERIVSDGFVVYVNNNNRNISITNEHSFWGELEGIFNSAIDNRFNDRF